MVSVGEFNQYAASFIGVLTIVTLLPKALQVLHVFTLLPKAVRFTHLIINLLPSALRVISTGIDKHRRWLNGRV